MSIQTHTATNLADIKAAPTNEISVVYDRSLWTWTLGNYTGQADDVDIVKADSTALSVGAWIRQSLGGSTFKAAYPTSVRRSAEAKAQDFVSIKDFGAKGAPYDDTVAIQAALDSGAGVIYFPAGEYLHQNLKIVTPYQRLQGAGAKLTRTESGATILVSSSARGVHFSEMRFGCQLAGMEGNNITVSAPDFRWFFSESRDCAGRALLIENSGGGAAIIGGVMQTSGAGEDDWDFEIRDDDGVGTLYCTIFSIITNQHTGGFLINGKVGTTTIDCCQFGKLKMINGGSSRVANCRINGDATILSGFATFVSCNFNGKTVFGEDGANNIGSICFEGTNLSASYGSLHINGNVVESSFNLGQIVKSGTPVFIHEDAYNNDIWHPLRDVSSQINLGAQSGAPTKGDAIISALMSAAGRDRTLRLSFQAGQRTNFGSGNYFTIVAPFKSKGVSTAPARITANAALFDWTAYIRDGSNQIKFTPSSGSGIGNDASASSPIQLGSGALIEVSLTVEQAF